VRFFLSVNMGRTISVIGQEKDFLSGCQ
jgi:hypothetical protein